MATTPLTETYTVGLPPSASAEVDGLIADLRTAVQGARDTLTKIGSAADAITEAVPLIQEDVRAVSDAVKNLKFSFSGPLGIHGQSSD